MVSSFLRSRSLCGASLAACIGASGCNALLDNPEAHVSGTGGATGSGGSQNVGGSAAGAGGDVDAHPDVVGSAGGSSGAGGTGGRDASLDVTSGGSGGARDASVDSTILDVSAGDGAALRDAVADARADTSTIIDARPDVVTCATGGSCTPMNLTTRSGSVQITSIGVAGPFLYFIENDGNIGNVYQVSTAGGTPSLLSSPMPANDPNNAPFTAIVADTSYVYATGAASSNVYRMSIVGGNFVPFGTTTGYGFAIRQNSTLLVIGGTLSNDYIQTMPKATGGSANVILTSSTTSYTELEADDSNVYILNNSGTAISRVPAVGGGANTVGAADPGEAITDLALAGDTVVFASNTRVGKVAAASGTPSTLDPGAAFGIASDATTAFYFRAKGPLDGGTTCASGADLYGATVAGGSPVHLASEPGGDAGACSFGVTLDSTSIYWITGDRKTIRKMSKTGG